MSQLNEQDWVEFERELRAFAERAIPSIIAHAKTVVIKKPVFSEVFVEFTCHFPKDSLTEKEELN